MASPSDSRRGRLLRVAGPVLVAVVAVLWFVLGPGGGSESTDGASGASGGSSSQGVRTGTDPDSGLAWVERADLPAQARATLDLIESDGPFPYSRDAITFGNRERLLPQERSGYYREFTVRTPGEDGRGARRIVAGDEGERYYSADHYDSFSRVRGDGA